MNCPNNIAECLLEILRLGLLRIRYTSQLGETERCQIEADHLHTLPNLLANYSDEKLQFYWQTERVCFIEANVANELGESQLVWEKLGRQMPILITKDYRKHYLSCNKHFFGVGMR